MENINIFSEIGRLKKVILHRPGNELINLTPSIMETLLFDEIPYLIEAQKEHDYFANIFRKNNIEVIYLVDLLSEILKDKNIKEELIDEYIQENSLDINKEKILLKELFMSIGNSQDLASKLIEGTRREEIGYYKKESLYEMIAVNYNFITLPMPNMYFTRDPFFFIGNHISLNKMWSKTRNRETIFGKYIFKYHRDFKDNKLLYNRDFKNSIEGGDILVLSKEIIAVGISQRTSAKAIEKFAENIFKESPNFKRILAFMIPKKREFMHLDTVFTMIDKDLFTVHHSIEEPLEVFSLYLEDNILKVEKESKKLKELLEKYLEVNNIKLISCGGNSKVDSEREQWNDGSNTLAIAPREVIVYGYK